MSVHYFDRGLHQVKTNNVAPSSQALPVHISLESIPHVSTRFTSAMTVERVNSLQCWGLST